MSGKKKNEELNQEYFDNILEAIKEVEIEKKGLRVTARCYGIDNTKLCRYLQRLKKKFGDLSKISDLELMNAIKILPKHLPSNMVFTLEQEQELKQYISKCADYYYGLSITELRQLAYQFACRIGIKYPQEWDNKSMAGKHWYYNFMKRHRNLTLRTPEHTSLNRVKAFCRENVMKFFQNLESVTSNINFEPENIWNMDETGFSTVPSKIGKVICLRGLKRVGQIASAERGSMVTMALAVNALGNSMPPFFLFPRKKMQSTFLDNASLGAVGFANSSGWMTQSEFLLYMKHFIHHTKASKDSPVLLLLDNHASHLSVEALDMAVNNGVTLLSFPPHCSHKMQPLDVSVYGPVKTYYKSQCSAWLKNNAGKVIEIRHIAGLVDKTLKLALSQKTITSGFEKTGICPYNPNCFSDHDFVMAVQNGENAAESALEKDLGEEDQRRIIINDNVLNVSAGKETSTCEVSTSVVDVASSSGTTSLSSVLSNIGPLQAATPRKLSNRGRKAMQSSILTLPENITALKDKKSVQSAKKVTSNKVTLKSATRKRAAPKKIDLTTTVKPSSKRPKKKKLLREMSSDDEDFCIICLKNLPQKQKLTKFNSIACNMCERPVHLKCANMRTSFYTCIHCDSD